MRTKATCLLMMLAALLMLCGCTAKNDDAVVVDLPEAIETPAPTESPAPSPTPPADARIRVAGDIIIDNPLLINAYSGGEYDFKQNFELIQPELSDADLTIANIEGAIAGKGELGYTGYPSFNTPKAILDAVKYAGVDMLTLANNHSLDRYYDGLMNTLRNVDAAGLTRTGAYRSKKDYQTPLVIELNGIKVGFTNYTTGLNGVESRSDERALVYGVRTTAKADYKKDINALRDAGAEIVVVLMHWDREYKRNPSGNTRKQAEQLVQAGADVIIGGHPHMTQPIEWIESSGRRALCIFSVGNFLSNHKGEYLDNGIIFEVGFSRAKDGSVFVQSAKYLPVWMWVQKSGKTVKYQVLAIEKALANRPDGMTDEQYERMGAALDELNGMYRGSVAEIAR